MNSVIVYVISQVLVAINYFLMIASYQLKDRKKILIYNLISLLIMSVSYFLLSAYAGIAMAILGIIRNVMFFYRDQNSKLLNVIELILLFILSTTFTVFTYDGLLSLTAVVAAMIYTVSLWQKNTKVYKALGIAVSVAGIIYNIYVKSILGAVFEFFSLISAIAGYLRECLNKRKTA